MEGELSTGDAVKVKEDVAYLSGKRGKVTDKCGQDCYMVELDDGSLYPFKTTELEKI
jgi:hypothetical protein